VFNFPNTLLDRVNLREHVVWMMPAEPDDTAKEDFQMSAEDYLRMGLVKLAKMDMPVPYEVENMSKDILVVGGGVSGMTAALDAAKAGYKVVLVEKENELGGFMGRMKMKAPEKSPYQELEPTGVEDKIKEVKGNGNIKVFTGCTIERIAGAPGMFDVSIKKNGTSVAERVGAIVQATGWKPYDANKLSDWGYGNFPNVITNVQMEEMAKAGKITRPSDGKEVSSVAFVQCAGSRDEKHLPYCSAVCCMASLKQATYVKQQNPDAATYIVYRDIRTPGQDENFYRAVQNGGTVFIRRDGDPRIEEGDEQTLSLEVKDMLLNQDVRLEELDLIVLATGMMPTTHTTEFDIPCAEGEEKKVEAVSLATKDYIPKTGQVLNLAYRQGPELPLLNLYGFPDSHFICFPYETRRTGIYAAGPVRRPMKMTTSNSDAAGAAMKAIQCVENVAVGSAVHPRVGDTTFPEFFMQRCTQCKRCTEECPFGAINEDEKGNPLPNPSRCRRCGVCMGACPERIISFKNYSVDMIGSMIKSIEVPGEDEEKPRIVALVCENDAYPALDMAGFKKLPVSPYIRFVPLRCLGSINLVWIADALSKGIDGVLLMGCKHGDDYQCHFIKGSELANIRMSKISETLNRLVLESDRIRVEQVSITDIDRIPSIVGDFVARIQEMDPNPYKDM
ncbi:MAG: FAD-dependent oxidoreductase, partial [Deltaproteobacteria bacterium]|nr:FAD-dependent oxidoreductase [Deltaproteobacteria bacterium]